jgi:hypothetical protein
MKSDKNTCEKSHFLTDFHDQGLKIFRKFVDFVMQEVIQAGSDVSQLGPLLSTITYMLPISYRMILMLGSKPSEVFQISFQISFLTIFEFLNMRYHKLHIPLMINLN